ncbi:MAG: hypothetical protein FD155_2247 [Bacteroidetes bacterium]|nr:MAG: hypothetical protein FD155_2247 [Bacteroidota bacterium]
MRFYITLFLTLFIFLGILHTGLHAQQAPTYENTIKSANEKFDTKDYISAKTYYEMALRLKADDAFASKRLSETITLIQKQMELQEVFYTYLDQGDQLQKSGSETEALASYQKALEIFPQDKYVSAQVSAISEKLRLASEKTQQFEQYTNLGNKLFSEYKFDEAIVQFNLANGLFPNDAQILKKISETQLAISKRNENEKVFQQLMLDADSQAKRKNYPLAIEKINEALKILPENDNALSKLTEIQTLETQQNAYNDQLAKADRAYEQKELESARSLYQKALEIWPDQAYALDMISRINQTLNNEELNRKKAIDNALAEAASLFDAQNFEAALVAYNNVLTLDPENEIAGKKLIDLTLLIAANKAAQQALNKFNELITSGDQFSTKGDFDNALTNYRQALALFPDDAAVKVKISQTEEAEKNQLAKAELDAKYQKIVTDADNLFNAGKLADARKLYEQALLIDATRPTPASQILIIDKTLEQQLLAQQQQEKKYSDLITTADQLIVDKKLELAIDQYRQALQIKPIESYPSEQINRLEAQLASMAEASRIEQQYGTIIAEAAAAEKSNQLSKALEAYTNASKLKQEETFPKEKVASITKQIADNEALAQKNAEYTRLIASADELFEAKSYTEAIQTYQQGLALNPEQAYPKTQISAIEKILGEQKAQAELQANFSEKIKVADQFFSTGQFQQAIVAYSEAQALIPANTYPKEQIILSEERIAFAENLRQKELKISALKLDAETLMTNSNLVAASGKYQEILDLDPDNSNAKAKKAEIALALEAQARELQANYEKSMAEAEQLISVKEYKQALSSLNAAIGFKPGDAAATQKITQVNSIIEERLLALKSEYNKVINEADRFYNTKSFDQAIDKYLIAEGIKPDESYPREMIKKIASQMEENKIRELNQALVLIPSNTSKRFEFEPVDITERRSNYIVIKAKNTGETSFPLLVSFGSKTGRNGGFVLPIPENGELNDFIVRIGQQYKWFSEDNTWIEFLPENGAVEVGLIQISKSN